ncbi:fibrinogen-like YCDxxxxGGGW domain-containing protein [Hyalangium versicolor]|uniref:fibrinogen-like YCDxxxxGGGW domain-containing protein n=1 Tax=Hyalangium versicolor TaxID=2861190 RepID=UPI001CCB95D3|nr:fibrinogen-like YCDxxxxGGGW domain-containing protein [Hyalangium versicolor]
MSGQAFSLQACPSGQVLQSNGSSGWGCAAATATDLTIGRISTNPGTSCLDIKTRMPSAESGIYLIDTDGSSGNPPFEVYCDMTRDGGGWTLIMRVWYQSGLAGNAGGFGSPREANSYKLEPYKLADATVKTIIGADNQFDILVDQVGHNTNYSTGNHEYMIVRNYTGVYRYTGTVAESSTPTVFESYRAIDNAIAWRGRLGCGLGGYGINCSTILSTPNPLGAPNPQGGLGCLLSMGTQTNAAWHSLFQGDNNTDTYIYICNSAQHTSSYSNVHRWFVR